MAIMTNTVNIFHKVYIIYIGWLGLRYCPDVWNLHAIPELSISEPPYLLDEVLIANQDTSKTP